MLSPAGFFFFFENEIIYESSDQSYGARCCAYDSNNKKRDQSTGEHVVGYTNKHLIAGEMMRKKFISITMKHF